MLCKIIAFCRARWLALGGSAFSGRMLLLCVAALVAAMALPARADSTLLADLPLRTKNRAKPNILFLLDNGQRSQTTYSPDGFSDALANMTKVGTAKKSTTYFLKKNGTSNTVQVQNWNAYGDTDWHYRGTGVYANGNSCATTGVCTLGGGSNSCPNIKTTPPGLCTDVFNRFYYDPTVTYIQPRDGNGALMSLPQTLYASAAAAQTAGCNCTDPVKCAWVDGFNPSVGCVDLGRSFSTAPYPRISGQLMPWSSRGTYPVGPYTPILGGIVDTSGLVVTMPYSVGLFTKYPAIPPGASVNSNGTGTALIYAPADSGNAFAGQYAYKYPLSNITYAVSCVVGTNCPDSPGNHTSYYPPSCMGASWFAGPTCSTGASANSCPVGGIVTGTVKLVSDFWCPLGQDLPGNWSSPLYCDVASQALTPNYPWNPCQFNTGGLKVYANPGPADFFDPDGSRHVITDAADIHFGTSPSNGKTQAQNITNFAMWHSFYRTRLLALKTSLSLAMYTANLNGNFRVGLAALANGVDGTQIGFGASTTATANYFSAIGDFTDSATPPHKAEWYNQLAKIQTSLTLLPDYVGALHNLYLWFVGSLPDPSLPASGYMTQVQANTTANTGADSQYLTVANAQGNLVATNRTGPLMYSCQANGLVLVATTPYQGITGQPALPNLSGTAGACADPYAASYSAGPTPCELSSAKVSLPSYVSSFYDPSAYPLTGSGVAGVTISPSDASWPYPFKAPSSNFYAGVFNGANPQTSMADLALYYWSHDLNQEFNTRTTSGVAVDVPKPDGSGKQGVPPFGSDLAYWPHVTTNVISLALAGQYDYSKTATLPAFNRGINTWPQPSVSNTASTTTLNSEDDSTSPSTFTSVTISALSQTYTSVDDLAHAAVNGHGKLLSTGNSTTLSSAFSGLFTDILQLSGSESAVAVANTQVSQTGTSYAFQSSYNTSGWWGELTASPISPVTGIIATYSLKPASASPTTTCTATDAGNAGWSAMCQLRNTLCPSYLPSNGCAVVPGANNATGRIIVSDKGDGSAAPGIPFTYSDLNTAGLASQLAVYGGDASAVVDFLRGKSSGENCASGASSGYRCRFRNGNTIDYWYPLGDVVDAEAVVIGPPQTSYADTGYAVWKATQANRTSVVFQGANDGMLHAFLVGPGTGAGVESWAYVPGFVLPTLNQLARQSYSHQYYVNATPTFGDANFGGGDSDWHTILTGGLGKGGKGYYALDVTTPTAGANESLTAAKVLWTFPNPSSDSTNCSGTVANVGYTYGRPVIGKVTSGGSSKWVVMVASGYSNADTKGHLYVLDAKTGDCLKDISNNSASSLTPGGMAYLAASVSDPAKDQTIAGVYAGDISGYVWKFGPANPAASMELSTWTATKLATLTDASGKPQPVTAELNLASIGGATMVFAGTGQYLGTQDVPASANFKGDANYVGQSMYGLMDDGASSYNSPARADILARQNSYNASHGTAYSYFINGDCTASSGNASNSCDFSNQFCTVQSALTRCFSPSLQASLLSSANAHAWVFDLPAGERIITSPVVALGALLFTSNQPVADPCQPGGKSYFYLLNYQTGGAFAGSAFVNQLILDAVTGDNVMASRPTLVQLADGRVVGLVSTSVGATLQLQNILSQPARRVSWREVPN